MGRTRTAPDRYEATAGGVSRDLAPTILNAHAAGSGLVGARMFKSFSNDDGYAQRFEGVVQSYHKGGDGEKATYRIKYSDGDREDLTLAEMKEAHRDALRPKAAKAKAKAEKAANKAKKAKKKPAAKKKKPAKKKKAAAKKKPSKKRKRSAAAAEKKVKTLQKQLAKAEAAVKKAKKAPKKKK